MRSPVKPSAARLSCSGLFALITLVSVAVLPACKDEPAATPINVDPTVRSYTVRGTLLALEHPRFGAGTLSIEHEAIPTFVNSEGEVSGMKAMTMPFPLGEGVSVDGLEPGHHVVVTFDVDYTREGIPHQVTAIAKTLDPPDLTGATGHSDPSDTPPADAPPRPNHGVHDPHGHPHGDHRDHVGTTHDHEHE